MRILGIDYGDRKIGLGFGDSETRIAVPLEVIANRGEETFIQLRDMIVNEDIDQVVVGVPLSTGGHYSPEQLEKTRRFIKRLIETVSVPVEEEDESYTTTESIRLQREEGTKADEDALAAMLIIRAYLERAE